MGTGSEALKAIIAPSRAEAWLEAAIHLGRQQKGEDYNIILEIEHPNIGNERSKEIEDYVDNFLVTRGVASLHTIAETIFPTVEYLRNGSKGVYVNYAKEIYPKIKKLKENQWGTYAHRLLCRKNAKGEDFVPLEACVDRLKAQLEKANIKGKGPYRAAYELGIVDVATDIPIHVSGFNRRIYGGPCLSHVSFKLGRNHELILTAFYRSHYYMQRALGNLLGLARLQSFVAKNCGTEVGVLVCHSTFGKLENLQGRWTKGEAIAAVKSLS